MKFENLSNQDRITIKIASISIEKLPQSSTEFHNKIWEAFKFGKEWQQLENQLNPKPIEQTPGQLDICKNCAAKKLFDESLK